ncbi:MAG: hypothetical protein JNJ54_26620 [Myxococcaceae bacterium]|nr:hypothetical protein [Myxococcaceae bacterium]
MAAKRKKPRAPKRRVVRAAGKKRRGRTMERLSATPPRSLPRDTPLELPAVTLEPRALIEPPPPLTGGAARSALVTRPETIEAAYEAWDELRDELAALRASFSAERARLAQQGQLLLGAVATVTPMGDARGEALTKRSELEALAAEARRGLEAAQHELEARARAAEAALHDAILAVVNELRARVTRQAARSKPVLELMVRVLPQERRILHLRRPSPDDAIVLVFAVSGRVPTRYGALFDDSTDDALLVPPVLYRDEGISEVRPKPAQLEAALRERPALWPIKAMVPMLLPTGFVRWLARGAVLEAELADGEGFRNLLTHAEAEQVTGALLALKLAGRIELELVRG